MTHASTYEYLKPTDEQIEQMAVIRSKFMEFHCSLGALLPDGPDKTFVLRELRTLGMWANVTITRLPDGTPRT